MRSELKPKRVALLLCVAFDFWSQFVLVSAAEYTAQVSFHCLSIRCQPAYASYFGVQYAFKLGSVNELDGLTDNGELAIRLEPQPTNSLAGYYQITASNNNDVWNEDFDITIPAVANPSGDLNYFWEVDQALDSVQTTGVFEDPRGGGGGVVVVTWSRKAGSIRGPCEIQMASPALGLTLDFNTTFELIEYTGTLKYTPGLNTAHGFLQLSRKGSNEETLSGTIDLKKIDASHLQVASFALNNEKNQQITHALEEPMTRRGVEYTGLVRLDDGNPATSEADYKIWHMSIRDNNDSDGNGIPDLSDLVPPPRPPSLRLTRNGAELRLELVAELGRDVTLEETSSLGENLWTNARTVTVTATPQIIYTTSPTSSAQYWRAKLQ